MCVDVQAGFNFESVILNGSYWALLSCGAVCPCLYILKNEWNLLPYWIQNIVNINKCILT